MRCHSVYLRLITLVMACVMLAGVLAACGQDAPATTEGTKPDATTESVPETTQREVTIVGDKLCHMTYNIAGSTGMDRVPNFDTDETKCENLKKYILEIDSDTFGIQEAPWLGSAVCLLCWTTSTQWWAATILLLRMISSGSTPFITRPISSTALTVALSP